MCKHCKPKEATPAAEAGNLTEQLALLLRDLVKPLTVHYGEAFRNQTADYIEGLEGLINRAEKLLATYHESLIRNPEPAYRYFGSQFSDYVWRMPSTGLGEVRFGPDHPWEESMYTLREIATIPGHLEIPNPDQ